MAVIGYPLMIRDQLIGAISVGRHRPEQRFVRDDLDRLASLAVPAALAIEHSRLYEELAKRVRELEATQAQLLQAGKLSTVGQLVSGVAHELNNPLSVILGYAQLLSARNLSAELRRPVEMMLAQGARMAKIVQSLLLCSRQRKAERGAVDVREAIEQPLSLRATQLMLSGVRVSATYGEGVPAAEGDAHQLQQVFLNLILNAEQAILGSRVGGRRVGDAIRVTTGMRVDERQTWVVITVADNGPGIPRDALPRIFEPFFTTKKVGEGTGLGLSVSYGIIQQHGGRMSVESRPGHTVFTIELPAATSQLPSRAAERAVEAGTGAGRGRHALVVDDEPGSPRSRRRALASGRLGGGDGDGWAGCPRASARRELRPRAGRHAHARRERRGLVPRPRVGAGRADRAFSVHDRRHRQSRGLAVHRERRTRRSSRSPSPPKRC